MTEQERLFALTEYERPLWARGIAVGGMDEVGRGPLAGPVVVACVVLPEAPLIEGINDSKKLSEKKRERLYEEILALAQGVGLGIVMPEVIDKINILEATKQAFREALVNTAPQPTHVLTDAMPGLGFSIEQTALIGGDARSYLIGAASIVAKVTRDRMMVDYDKEYPHYGFAAHKGYGTKAHFAAIEQHGLCPIHRRSFLKKYL